MQSLGKPLKTRKHKCPYCRKSYRRLALSERLHPQIKELPCFECAHKGVHRVDSIHQPDRP